ncbi:MAG: DUF3499 family protein [Actinobacteria bacterium]|nr:DUF3499 family protein [Actinomycetota bacterium]MTA91378.1 DUF3499 family protein [Actinomycetota bacterium]
MARSGRSCSRVSCRALASMTLTYIYADSTAVLGPLATFSEPHSYDLCDAHGKRLTVPNGWTVIKEESSQANHGPSDDDLMAIADAVREVAANHQSVENKSQGEVASENSPLGRRGHLRAVPS